MILVQKLSIKAASVVTVKDFSVCFNDRLMNLSGDFDEIIVVFYTHRLSEEQDKTEEIEREGPCAVSSPR